MILEINSGSGGGGVCMRIELAGATAITTREVNAPSSDHPRTVMIRQRRAPPHHQAAQIPRPSTVIIKAVGGSESPPISKGMRKHNTWIKIEGERCSVFRICFSRNVPKKGRKTSGAKCEVIPARQYNV